MEIGIQCPVFRRLPDASCRHGADQRGGFLGNRTLSAFPALKTEEGLNVNWLSDAGDYFQDHFAFRNELVTANALVNGKIFQVSTASGVIQGTDGWLYYKDSLDDYLGINQAFGPGAFQRGPTPFP